MNLKGWISWQITLVCAGCFLLGAGAAFVGAVHFLQIDMAVLAGDLKRKNDRVLLLEGLVIQQSRTTVARALDQAPPPASEAPVAVAAEVATGPAQESIVVAAAEPVHAPGAEVVSPRRSSQGAQKAADRGPVPAPLKVLPAHRSVGTDTRQAAAAAASTPTPAAAKEPTRAPSEEGADTAQAPTPAEIAAVVKTARIEGVSAEKAGVERLSAAAVHLRGGKVIKVGSLFPSGERLMAVDPENGRVITNQRQILMFF